VRGDFEAFEVMPGETEFWSNLSSWKTEIALSTLRIKEIEKLRAFVRWITSNLERVFSVKKWQDLGIDLIVGSKHVHVRRHAGSISAGIDWFLGDEHNGVNKFSDFAGEI
jgi:hypothetical protein